MICPPCKTKEHDKCTNPRTCPCQHRVTKLMDDGTLAPLSAWGGALKDPEAFKKRMVNDAKTV